MDLVGPTGVVTDPDLMTAAVHDWTGRWVGSSPAIVYPRSTDEVVAVINWCREHQTAVVPQGGNTGMVGGSVPLNNEVVLNLTRMDRLSVDPAAGHLTADPGVTIAAVQEAATRAGWTYGIDFGSRDTATLGGSIATNAGGIHVLRHGDTRQQLLGIQAVTGAGEVVGDLRGLVKDNTGYHLPSLLAGSEGTLAVVTAACVRLGRPSDETAVALIGFGAEATAIDAVAPLRAAIGNIAAMEIFFADGLDLVCESFDLAHPMPARHAAYLLVEAAGTAGTTDRLAEEISRAGIATESTAVGLDQAQCTRLWRYREAHTEAISMLGTPHKLDITVPLHAMAGFVEKVRARVGTNRPEAKTWLFGHAGDGNLHVNITGIEPEATEVDRVVLDLVIESGGSISAEHGIGRAKAQYLHMNRSDDELALARRLKHAFDPAAILNPGVLLT